MSTNAIRMHKSWSSMVGGCISTSLAINIYRRQSCKFLSKLRRGILDTTRYDKVCRRVSPHTNILNRYDINYKLLLHPSENFGRYQNGLSEAVNKKGRTIQWENRKEKGQTMDYKTLHRKLKIEQHKTTKTRPMILGV